MSEPKRYNPSGLVCTCCGNPDAEILSIMVTHKKGRYVLWEDFVALDKLCKQLMAQHSDISCENIMLRKAGDAVVNDLEYLTKSGWFNKCKSVKRWNSAKEGRPNE